MSLRIEARIGAESDFFVSFDYQKFPILLTPFAFARDMACTRTDAPPFEKTTSLGKGRGKKRTRFHFIFRHIVPSLGWKRRTMATRRRGLDETKGLTRCFET